MTRSPSGHRCGQSHQKAKLTDAQVIAMRKRYIPYVVSYKTLSKEFNCGESTARDICQYVTRINV